GTSVTAGTCHCDVYGERSHGANSTTILACVSGVARAVNASEITEATSTLLVLGEFPDFKIGAVVCRRFSGPNSTIPLLCCRCASADTRPKDRAGGIPECDPPVAWMYPQAHIPGFPLQPSIGVTNPAAPVASCRALP